MSNIYIFNYPKYYVKWRGNRQFGAYQEIALNKPIIDAANILYWDDSTKNLKRGAAGKGGGSARRLVRIIRQYQMANDLNSMKGNEIVELLPSEFAKWSTPTN